MTGPGPSVPPRTAALTYSDTRGTRASFPPPSHPSIYPAGRPASPAPPHAPRRPPPARGCRHHSAGAAPAAAATAQEARVCEGCSCLPEEVLRPEDGWLRAVGRRLLLLLLLQLHLLLGDLIQPGKRWPVLRARCRCARPAPRVKTKVVPVCAGRVWKCFCSACVLRVGG